MTVEHDLLARAEQNLATAALAAEQNPDAAATLAYYAAFYAVSAALHRLGRSFKTHNGVRAALRTDLVRAGKLPVELAEEYDRLIDARDIGSYGVGQHVSVHEAQDAVTAARRVVDAVRPLLPALAPPG